MNIDLLKEIERLSDFRKAIKEKESETMVLLNKKIIESYEAGVNMPILAKATGLTVGRISQIISKSKES